VLCLHCKAWSPSATGKCGRCGEDLVPPWGHLWALHAPPGLTGAERASHRQLVKTILQAVAKVDRYRREPVTVAQMIDALGCILSRAVRSNPEAKIRETLLMEDAP